MSSQLAKSAKSSAKAFEALRSFDLRGNKALLQAGKCFIWSIAPLTKGHWGVEGKAKYDQIIKDFETQCVNIACQDPKLVRQAIDVARFCALVPEAEQMGANQLAALLPLLGPIKPSDGCLPYWKVLDQDPPGFDRGKLAVEVVAKILAGDLKNPEQIKAALALEGEKLTEAVLAEATPEAVEDYKAEKAVAKARQDKRQKASIATRAEKLGMKVVDGDEHASVAKRMLDDVAFREGVFNALLELSAKRDTTDAKRHFETVLATARALAAKRV